MTTNPLPVIIKTETKGETPITIIIPDNPSISLQAKLHPFLQAHKPHLTPGYKLLTHKDRMTERNLAHLAGEWRHPAVGEDDKMMDLVVIQHQTNRSWHHIRTDLTKDYFTSHPQYDPDFIIK